MARPIPVQEKGSQIRPNGAGGMRSYITAGPSALASVADDASATFTFDFQEPGVLDKLVIVAGAATALVAGAATALVASDGAVGGLSGWAVTAITVNGDSLLSGMVPAALFHPMSVANPTFGHSIGNNSKVSVTLKNASGATAEVLIGFSIA